MPEENSPLIAFTKYSPFFLIDLEKLEDSKWNSLILQPVTMLCGRGVSKFKHFCDGKHLRKKFSDA